MEEGGGGGDPVTYVGLSYNLNPTQIGTTGVPIPPGVAAGDLVLMIWFRGGAGNVPARTGWNALEWNPNAWEQIGYSWRIHQAGDTTLPVFSGSGSTLTAHCYVLRGADPSSPIINRSYYNANYHLPGAPSITVDLDGAALLWDVYQQSPRTTTSPPGFTYGASGGGGPAWWSTYKLSVPAGATGDIAGTFSSAVRYQCAMIAIRPAAFVPGVYWRWTSPAPSGYGWHYVYNFLTEPDLFDAGATDQGYWIEARFPESLGGTEPEGQVMVDVYNYAQTTQFQHSFSETVPPLIHVWVCNALSTGDSVIDPIDDLSNPFPCPDGVTVTLEDAVCHLMGMSRAMLGYLININHLLGAIYGPWTATAGQAQELVEGNLGEFVQGAVQVLSNYRPTGMTENLVEAGITGDWTVAGLGMNFRINLTAIPAWSSHRESDPILYEVNRRAEQLGWYAFAANGMLTPWRQLTWDSQYLISPTPVTDAIHVHLMAGVTGTVYQVVETYTPVLAAP